MEENVHLLGVESNDEMNSRQRQARAAARQLNSLLCSNKKTKNKKIKMYKEIVESIRLYGAEL